MLTLEPLQFSQRVLKLGLLEATLVETSVVLVEVDCEREIQEDPTGDAADARCVTGSEHPAEGENH